jgi:hypothetical protein
MEASAHLTTIARTAMIGVVLLAAVSLASSAHPQSANDVAGMCANYARQSWPDDYRYNEYQRARQQIYINCMMEHGLRP